MPFYVTHLEPNDWWKWFLDPSDERLKVKKETGGSDDVSGEGEESSGDEERRLDQPEKTLDADRGWTEVHIIIC